MKWRGNVEVRNKRGEIVITRVLPAIQASERSGAQERLIWKVLEDLPDGEYNWSVNLENLQTK